MIVSSPIAAIDLGSNSFRLQIAQVIDQQIYPIDSLKQIVRLAADITEDNALSEASMHRALLALSRFAERLRGFDAKSVRAVGTNSFRVTTNGEEFLKRAESALGFSIEVIAGREEARLIYLGAAHTLPNTIEKRLIVDIGGGSTEFIIGTGYRALETDSLVMGCVSYSQRYFPDGLVTAEAFHRAEFEARDKVQTIAQTFNKYHWARAIGTSGTSRSLVEILEINHYATAGITLAGMYQLKEQMIKAGKIERLTLQGLRPDRSPVLAGGLAIMIAIFEELEIETMTTTVGALRDGLLYDLVGRAQHTDLRQSTVQEFVRRYHVDRHQAKRVQSLAIHIFKALAGTEDEEREEIYTLKWAAQLHEIGRSISYASYHKHSAYILQHADMPGFTQQEQMVLAVTVLAHRGSLKKLTPFIQDQCNIFLLLALRLASIFYRSRIDINLPVFDIQSGPDNSYTLIIPQEWLVAHPLTAYALDNESRQWQNINIQFAVQKVPTKN